MDDISARDFIMSLRKEEFPRECDFCGVEREADELEPEEAGEWVCHTCLKRWGEMD